MGDLDLVAKVVLREDPAAVLGLFMPDPALGVIRLAPTETVKLQVLMDSLLEVDLEGVGRCWLHFEFLAGWKHDAPQTTFRNWSLALPAHNPLLSIVVVHPSPRSPREPRRRAPSRPCAA